MCTNVPCNNVEETKSSWLYPCYVLLRKGQHCKRWWPSCIVWPICNVSSPSKAERIYRMEYRIVHIICHYYVFQHIMIGLCMSFWILHTFRHDGTYSCASIMKNQAANCLVLGQYTSCNNYFNTHYYVLLRIITYFLQKCCFMMSFVVFTHNACFYLLLTFLKRGRQPLAGDPCLGRSIIGRNKH